MKTSTWKHRIALSTAAAGLLLLSACGGEEAAAGSTSTTGAVTAQEALADNAEPHADGGDAEDTVDTASATTITLADGGSTSSDESAATVDGDTVTISSAGTYVLSGSLDDGRVVVSSEGDGEVTLVLDGVDITSESDSPLVVTQADAVTVVLAKGSQNALADGAGSAADDEEEDAANATLWSSDDLTIAGSGALSVTSLEADGITSKDGLVVLGGEITVEAGDDGIRGKDYLALDGGTIEIRAGGDGLKSDDDTEDGTGYVLLDGATVTADVGDDGISATTDALVVSGSLDVTATAPADEQDPSPKGINAGAIVAISGGEVTVDDSEEAIQGAVVSITDGTVDLTATDDGINASSGSGESMAAEDGVELVVSGGSVTVDAEGDGLDSNGTTTITGGTVVVDGPTRDGNGALDAAGGTTVAGGSLVAVGSAGMAEAPAEGSEQGWLQASLGTAAAGAEVTVQDEDGREVATHTLAKAAANLVVANDDIEAGRTYTVLVDGQQVASVTAGESTGGGMGGGPGGGGPAGGGPGGDMAPPDRQE